MKSSGRNISLTSYDDLFSTEETRQADAREQIQQIPLSELHDFLCGIVKEEMSPNYFYDLKKIWLISLSDICDRT